MKHLPLVLINGWGMPAQMLAPLAEALGVSACLSLDDALPVDAQGQLDVAACLSGLPAQSVLLGWSLGGQIAAHLAWHAPERVAGLVTIAATPRFAATDDWPGGVDPAQLAAFRHGLMADPLAQWQRFLLMQIQGDHDLQRARRDLQAIRKAGPQISPPRLLQTLDWLHQWDQRARWHQLSVPRLHLFGAEDLLVKPLVVDATPTQQQVIAGMAHWPHPGHLAAVQAAIRHFLHRVAG